MSLTSDQVKHVAILANLPLTDEEENTYSKQLSKILEYIEHLNRVKTDGTEPIYNVTGLFNVMSEDQTQPSLSQEEVLQNAPTKKDGKFLTKGVFEGE